MSPASPRLSTGDLLVSRQITVLLKRFCHRLAPGPAHWWRFCRYFYLTLFFKGELLSTFSQWGLEAFQEVTGQLGTYIHKLNPRTKKEALAKKSHSPPKKNACIKGAEGWAWYRLKVPGRNETAGNQQPLPETSFTFYLNFVKMLFT